MKTEVSAGGVVIRKIGHEWYVLVIKDMNGFWTFPKGIIERNEDSKTAAKREIFEETGLENLQYLKTLPDVMYVYKRKVLIQKTVHYFLFHSPFVMNTTLTPQTNEGISEAQWMPLIKATEDVGYAKTNKMLLQTVQTFLETNPLL